MFESLQTKLADITQRMRGKARVTEADIKDMMREIRMALLEADVEYGVVKDFVGGYSEYRSFMEDLRQQERSRQTAQAAPKPQKEKPSVRKLTWKEQREMEALEAELEALAGEQAELEALLAGGTQDYKLISEASERYKEVRALVDEKETRWLELNEI